MCFKPMEHYINHYFYIDKYISCEVVHYMVSKSFSISNICYFNNIPLFKAPVVPIPGDQVWSRCFLFIPPELLPLFISCALFWFDTAWIILRMHPANGRRSYNVMPYLIGWVHTQNDPWQYSILPISLWVTPTEKANELQWLYTQVWYRNCSHSTGQMGDIAQWLPR